MWESSGIENTEVKTHKLRTRRVVLTFILLSLGVALAMCIGNILRIGQVGFCILAVPVIIHIAVCSMQAVWLLAHMDNDFELKEDFEVGLEERAELERRYAKLEETDSEDELNKFQEDYREYCDYVINITEAVRFDYFLFPHTPKWLAEWRGYKDWKDVANKLWLDIPEFQDDME